MEHTNNHEDPRTPGASTSSESPSSSLNSRGSSPILRYPEWAHDIDNILSLAGWLSDTLYFQDLQDGRREHGCYELTLPQLVIEFINECRQAPWKYGTEWGDYQRFLTRNKAIQFTRQDDPLRPGGGIQ